MPSLLRTRYHQFEEGPAPSDADGPRHMSQNTLQGGLTLLQLCRFLCRQAMRSRWFSWAQLEKKGPPPRAQVEHGLSVR